MSKFFHISLQNATPLEYKPKSRRGLALLDVRGATNKPRSSPSLKEIFGTSHEYKTRTEPGLSDADVK